MKKLSVLALAALALSATAQNKIDFPGRMVIEQMHQLAKGEYNDEGLFAKMSYNEAAAQKYGVLVDFGNNAIDFGDLDIEELSQIGNIAVVNVTAQQMEQIAQIPQVLSVQLGYEKKPMLYMARPACDVDKVQQGDGLSMKYTGKGVVTGLFDSGLDVNHINFLNEDGTPRTKRLWVYSTSSGRGTEYSTPTQISNYTTESSSESHGTHVLGIMSGSYNGPAAYSFINGNRVDKVTQDAANSAIPFYGVATGSDLAVSCGPLYDANIINGVLNIMNYAQSQGQPAVVNLSVGANIGPHDGTDATSKSLTELGKKGIICIAAGNEGDQNISITADGETVKTLLSNDGSSRNANGVIQFWGSDNQPFTVRLIGYNSSSRQEVFSYTLSENLGGKSVSKNDMTGFTNAFSSNSTATLSSNVDPANNRYNVNAQVNITPNAGIYVGFVIEPKDGQWVDGFTNGILFVSRSEPGFTSGSPDNSINDMACGDNLVVVGSFTTAASWATINGTTLGYQPKPAVGAISSFSSYGTTFQGRPLPDVCAPGEAISASYNQYYANAGKLDANLTTGIYTDPRSGLMARNSTWGIMQGTSMASPFAAGVIALWLEAEPTLTYAQVMDVIKNSSTKQLGNSNKWGAGKINALQGIKYVLENYAGVTDVAVDKDNVFVTSTDGHNYEVYVAGASKVTASLYTLSGLCVEQASANGNSVNIAADAAPGVYVLRVESPKASHTQKIAVR